jgi:AraC-like DNA-binding protein
VDRFWVSTAAANAEPRRILPDGCLDLIVDLTDGGHAVAVGTMTRAVVFHPEAPVRTVAVRFRPGGAFPFLGGVSADELTDRVVDSTDLGAGWLVSLRFDRATRLGVAVETLQRCLLRRLTAAVTVVDSCRPGTLIVRYVVDRLLESTPPSIAELNRETGFSRQHLARMFRRRVGVGPKQMARVARLQRAIAQLQVGGRGDGGGRGDDGGLGGNLAGAAIAFGYFDQAHMARDFRKLAGITPLEARASAGSIFPIRSLFARRGFSP